MVTVGIGEERSPPSRSPRALDRVEGAAGNLPGLALTLEQHLALATPLLRSKQAARLEMGQRDTHRGAGASDGRDADTRLALLQLGTELLLEVGGREAALSVGAEVAICDLVVAAIGG